MGAGVEWRGRCWRIAGGADDDPVDDQAAAAAAAANAALETAREEGRAEVRAQAEQAAQRTAELEHLLADANQSADRVAELEAQLAAEQEARSSAESRGLDAHRRALVAAHAGEIVDELVQGATEEALDASVGLAKAAYDRIRDAVTTGQHVPPGATERGTGDLDGLSPLEKISRGLTK